MSVNRLKNIIKGSYLLHYVPKRWLGVRIIFIPKPDKDTYSDPRSFRPISLMNFVLKVMEKILLWQNEEKVLSQKPLHKNQHGFRKARSTDSALTSFVGRIEYAFLNNEYALAVFLDIQGAFDNLTNGAIIRALRARGCDELFINWILDFLKFRQVKI